VRDGRKLGSLIGAIGGLVFVLANSGELAAGTALKAVAVVLFVVTLVAIARGSAPPPPPPTPDAIRTYWLCVTGEVLAIPGGAAVLRGLDHEELVPIWVVLVVGVHFVPFARAFATPLFAWLGLLLIATSIAGGAVSLAGWDDAAPWTAVAGGFMLLGFSLGGLLRPSRP
jgi:hypothetical protein